jgi:hypothetical protein
MTTVVSVFDDLCLAQRAVADLIGSGFSRDVISVIVRHFQGPNEHAAVNGDGRDPTGPSVLAGGPLSEALRATGHDESAVADALKRAGLPPSAALLFAEAVGAGAILVAVHCEEAAVRDARDILDVYATPEPRLTQGTTARGGRQDLATIGQRRAEDTPGRPPPCSVRETCSVNGAGATFRSPAQHGRPRLPS